MAEDRAKAEENVEELEKWARVRERGYAYPRVLLKLSGEALAGDVGCAAGPGLVGLVSGGAGLSAGLMAACVFPVLMLASALCLSLRRAAGR